MKKIKIGVSGDIGSFSEQAANEHARKNGIKNYEIKCLISVEKVLTEIDKKEIDLGIFPIENSNGGVVIESVYAISRHTFKIKEIFEIPVVHCLLTKPGIEKEDIKNIASHDQALKQCKTYLKRNWGETGLHETEDTAKSAKDLSEGNLSKDTAVLAPESCATLYGLIVMEKGIQDLKFNFTNFLAVEK
ncbi:MAG: prephenate dehydratase [Candidatus Pacebacteria bacterium]|nr:prephenate dehydratase [Candidatus Paceibacterota bacterium]